MDNNFNNNNGYDYNYGEKRNGVNLEKDYFQGNDSYYNNGSNNVYDNQNQYGNGYGYNNQQSTYNNPSNNYTSGQEFYNNGYGMGGQQPNNQYNGYNNGYGNNYSTNSPGYGKSIGSLVCGICSIVFTGLGVVLGIIAVVLANSSKSADFGVESSTAKAGKICGIIGIILSSMILLLYIVIIGVSCSMSSSNLGYTSSLLTFIP